MLYNFQLTGYELKKHIENGVGVFYKASYGSIYPVLRRLAESGLVTVLEERQGGREKKLYNITPEGRQVFLQWLGEPIHAGDGGGHQSHLAKVYFFDVLPPDTVSKLLIEYEANNTRYLNRLLELERFFNTPANRESHYYKLSTLYYGIGVLRETLRWCQQVRERHSFHIHEEEAGGIENGH